MHLAIKFDGVKKDVMEMLLCGGEVYPSDNSQYIILKMNGSTIQLNRPIGDNDNHKPLPTDDIEDDSDDDNDEIDSDDPNNYQAAQ